MGGRTGSGGECEGDPAPKAATPILERCYAALDLGTNNCRLLIARPTSDGFKVIDSFSRIVRLGEGLTHSGRLCERAIERTIEALLVCREKLSNRGVGRARLIATEACRAAVNGAEFIGRVAASTGLRLEIVDRETEAGLATAGCASLADAEARAVVLFDIGGGSSEIVWLDRGQAAAGDASVGRRPGASDWEAVMRNRMRQWVSLRLGVVTLAEGFGGRTVSEAAYRAMVEHVTRELAGFVDQTRHEARCPRFHLLGTSGTVTTLAGVHLGLPRYDRRRIDGLWLTAGDVDQAIGRMRGLSFEERASHGCIGPDRADLVLAGCAIFEAIRAAFPAPWIRIADRGLREGLLMQMMAADGVWRHGRQADGMR